MDIDIRDQLKITEMSQEKLESYADRIAEANLPPYEINLSFLEGKVKSIGNLAALHFPRAIFELLFAQDSQLADKLQKDCDTDALRMGTSIEALNMINTGLDVRKWVGKRVLRKLIEEM